MDYPQHKKYFENLLGKMISGFCSTKHNLVCHCSNKNYVLFKTLLVTICLRNILEAKDSIQNEEFITKNFYD